MRSFKLWATLVPLALLSLVPVPVTAAPALTTVQDTLYKADGTRFNGVAYIDWKSFQAADSSAIATSSVVVPIVDGALRVRLVPTSNASAGAHYNVRYQSDGKVQFIETWNVIPSSSPVPLSAVRVAAGAATGGATTPPAALTITDITGLTDELSARPVKGFSYATDRVLKSGSTGALETVNGNLTDCIRVDGTTGPCGSGTGSSGPSFIDQEVPSGLINGSNTVFTLTQAPSPAGSLQIYRNGILLSTGADYTLSGSTVTFGAASTPRTGDLVSASYRIAAAGGVAVLNGALTGSWDSPQLAAGVVSNYNVAAAAGIAESKLALQYPTHSNANDPTAGEKAALSGTAGTPSATNKFVTDNDIRVNGPRPAQAHNLLGPEHGDTAAGSVQRGDLVFGSFATGAAKWSRLPLGPANRCLVSNGADAVWNACLFTGFRAGGVPFTGADGVLAESPLHFVWDASNRRLSVGSNLNASTLSVHDGGLTGATTLTVRAGQSQGQNPLQVWQNGAGLEQGSLGADGVLAVRAVEAITTTARPAWRESGSAADPASTADGDAWYNTTAKARRSVEAGQVHAAAQVICAAEGTSVTSGSLSQAGSCTIPAGLLRPGDRLAIRATWIRTGSGNFTVRWRWGSVTVGQVNAGSSTNVLNQKGESALFDGGAIIEIDGAASLQAIPPGLTLGFEGSVNSSGDTLRLAQFTVIRYPGQSNP